MKYIGFIIQMTGTEAKEVLYHKYNPNFAMLFPTLGGKRIYDGLEIAQQLWGKPMKWKDFYIKDLLTNKRISRKQVPCYILNYFTLKNGSMTIKEAKK